MNFVRSKVVSLKPVVLEETIGITSTEDALIDSSPRPSEREPAACKGNIRKMISAHLTKGKKNIYPRVKNQSTFAFNRIIFALLSAACANEPTSFISGSSVGSLASLQFG